MKRRHLLFFIVVLSAPLPSLLAEGDAAALSRLARKYSDSMTADARDPRNRELGAKALDYARRAKAANPDDGEVRLTLAIAYGKVARLESPRIQMEYSRQIKEEAEAALRLDPEQDDAWHVLGRWNHEIASLNVALRLIAQAIYGQFPAASLERAAECFEKAIALRPDRVLHHGELGRTYAALGRKEKARAELETALRLPSREKDDDEAKIRARQALDAL